LVAERKESFGQRGWSLAVEPALGFARDPAWKAAIVGCHASQRQLLGRGLHTALRSSERIWRLVRR
jgi:hypothetical protein